MDTATPTPLSTEPSGSDAAPVSPPGRPSRLGRPEQPRLPLLDDAAHDGTAHRGTGSDDEHDRPIGFALTARARRIVAPDSLPDLAVVPAPRPSETDDDDTRPARARALRRAGVPVARIATQLDADPLLVTAWTGEVAVRAHTSPSAQLGGAQDPGVGASSALEVPEDGTARALARAEAARRARERIAVDPAFALVAGLLVGVAEVDAHAVTVTSDDVRLVRRIVDELSTERPELRGHARIVVRVGPAAAGDLARHRTATALGLDRGQVTWTRWRTPPRPEAVRILLRVADPALADDVAGTLEAVLDPAPCAADDGF